MKIRVSVGNFVCRVMSKWKRDIKDDDNLGQESKMEKCKAAGIRE